MLKKVLFMIIAIFLGMNTANLMKEPYFIVGISEGSQYGNQYVFTSFKYETMLVFFEDVNNPDNPTNIGNYSLEDFEDKAYSNLLNLSESLLRKGGTFTVEVDREKKNVYVHAKSLHKESLGISIEMGDLTDQDISNHQIRFITDKDENKVKLVELLSEDNKVEFIVYVEFR